MSRRASTLWRRQRRNAVESAEQLVRRTCSRLPVNLQELSKHRRVSDIRFTQLLTDGGLAPVQDGFVIYVRCKPEEGPALTEAMLQDGTGRGLPERLVRRARFTIAHEIAHTLFFDTNSKPPRSKLSFDDDKINAELERACNEIAGLLVLPETLIPAELLQSHLITPQNLRRLADEAIISGQTLIRRFIRLRRSTHPEAIMTSIARDGHDWRITAISRHYTFRDVFSAAAAGSSVKHLISDPDFILFGGEMRDVEVAFIGHGGRRRQIHFTCEIGSSLRRGHDVLVVGIPGAD